MAHELFTLGAPLMLRKLVMVLKGLIHMAQQDNMDGSSAMYHLSERDAKLFSKDAADSNVLR